MTTYTLFRLSDRQAQKELATQRRYMQRHRAELADTRNPDALRRYIFLLLKSALFIFRSFHGAAFSPAQRPAQLPKLPHRR